MSVAALWSWASRCPMNPDYIVITNLMWVWLSLCKSNIPEYLSDSMSEYLAAYAQTTYQIVCQTILYLYIRAVSILCQMLLLPNEGRDHSRQGSFEYWQNVKPLDSRISALRWGKPLLQWVKCWEATAATDLAAMACALSNFKRFEVGLGITEAQQKDVTQAGKPHTAIPSQAQY